MVSCSRRSATAASAALLSISEYVPVGLIGWKLASAPMAFSTSAHEKELKCFRTSAMLCGSDKFPKSSSTISARSFSLVRHPTRAPSCSAVGAPVRHRHVMSSLRHFSRLSWSSSWLRTRRSRWVGMPASAATDFAAAKLSCRRPFSGMRSGQQCSFLSVNLAPLKVTSRHVSGPCACHSLTRLVANLRCSGCARSRSYEPLGSRKLNWLFPSET
mmetsp:Transcript_27423/g.93620  ORF Transcript_27423/g.93620 Transcript_27423/m.93620 type:complete len:215 (+) Transcript_27423:1710-2354(+)